MTDRDRILQRTKGGYDVFVHYLGEGCKKKMFRNPFREDSVPSCHLYYNEDNQSGEGRWVIKDFGDSEWVGDCFWLVGRLTGLSLKNDFQEILRIIDRECNLFILDDASDTFHPVMAKVVSMPVVNDKPLRFIPKYRNFNKYELNYWMQYGIERTLLERYNVRCLSSCYFERTDGSGYNIYGSSEVPMFGYTFFDGAGIKVYRPHATIGRFLYAGSMPKPYVFGWDQLSSVWQPYVIVTGGEKDVLSLSAHGFQAICLSNETARPPFAQLFQLADRFKNIIFLYDSDETGKRESALRASEWNEFIRNKGYGYFFVAKSITLPLSGSKQEKDVSDFFKSGRSADDLRLLMCDALNGTSKTEEP